MRAKKIASGYEGGKLTLKSFPIENLRVSPVLLEETKDDLSASDKIRLVLFALHDSGDAVALWTFSQLSSNDPSHVFQAASVFAGEIDLLLELKTQGAIGNLFAELVKSGKSLACERLEMPKASRYRYMTQYGEEEILVD